MSNQQRQDIAAQQKQEKLQEYQRQFRNLQSDRKAYAEQTVALIQKQRGIIDKYKNENHQLKDMISKMNATQLQSQAVTGTSNDSVVEELQEKIKQEEQEQKEIKVHLDEFQEKIKNQRGNMGGYNAGAQNDTSLTKQIKILQNRLDKANQKFNEAIAVNKSLRQQIDSLRRERVIFDTLYKKLEKELHQKRKKMANIIETANTAYEQRDQANDAIQSLKQMAKRQSADFEKELRELSHLVEQNQKTLDIIKITDKNENVQSSDVVDADQFNQAQAQKIYQDRTNNQTTNDRINKYQEDFAKIQAATKITDFDQLINLFIKNQDKNFQLFQFINELSNQMQDLEKQKADLEFELKDYSGSAGDNTDLNNKTKLKQLEEKLSRFDYKSERFEFKYHDSVKLILSLTNWIETLFNTIECDQQVAKELAGSHGVTDGNMMIFLGIIEQRVNQIVHAYAAIKAEQSQQDYPGLLSNGSNFSANLYQKKNEIPPYEEFDQEEPDGEKILTLEDFQQNAIEKLERNQNQKNNNQTAQQPGQR